MFPIFDIIVGSGQLFVFESIVCVCLFSPRVGRSGSMSADDVLLPLVIVGGCLLVLVPIAVIAYKKHQERRMREQCADILSGYMSLADDGASLEVPLYTHQMPQLQQQQS